MKVLPQFKILEDFFKNSEWEKVEWLEGAAPHFNIKKIPPWKNAYWIGDALVSLPPAIGYGFMHSIISAMMAADFYLQNKPEAFSKLIRNQIHLKFYLGKLMHHTMIQPYLSQIVFPLFQKSPWFLNQCLKRLGY